MGSMVPGQPNFFQQFMAAYTAGLEARRAREEYEAQKEQRQLQLDRLKFEQGRIKLEDKLHAAELNRKGSLENLAFLQSQPTPQQALPEGIPGPPQPTGPTSMEIPGISIPESGINVPSLQAPIQYREDIAQQLARQKEMEMLDELRKKQLENQIPTPGPLAQQYGETIDARAIPLLPKPPESLSVEPGQLPFLPQGGTLPKPLLDQLAGVWDQQQQNNRSAASVGAQYANASATREQTQGNRTFQQEQALRDDFAKKTLRLDDVNQRIDQATQLATAPPSGQNDMALVFTFMKTLDDSVVRETEYARAAQIGSLKERARASMQALQNGQLLTPAQRAGYLQTLSLIQKSVNDYRSNISNQYATMAQRKGLDPQMVIGSGNLVTPGGSGGGPPRVRSIEEAMRLPKGTQFYDPNGVLRTVP